MSSRTAGRLLLALALAGAAGVALLARVSGTLDVVLAVVTVVLVAGAAGIVVLDGRRAGPRDRGPRLRRAPR